LANIKTGLAYAKGPSFFAKNKRWSFAPTIDPQESQAKSLFSTDIVIWLFS
jgi:hypothetical protein